MGPILICLRFVYLFLLIAVLNWSFRWVVKARREKTMRNTLKCLSAVVIFIIGLFLWAAPLPSKKPNIKKDNISEAVGTLLNSLSNNTASAVGFDFGLKEYWGNALIQKEITDEDIEYYKQRKGWKSVHGTDGDTFYCFDPIEFSRSWRYFGGIPDGSGGFIVLVKGNDCIKIHYSYKIVRWYDYIIGPLCPTQFLYSKKFDLMDIANAEKINEKVFEPLNRILINKILINGEEVNHPDTIGDNEKYFADTLIYNLTDNSINELIFEAKAEAREATFTYNSDISGFAKGENSVIVTANAKGKEQQEITIIVGKYDEDGLIAYDLYQKALAIYWFEGCFSFDSNHTVMPEGENDEFSLITNYSEVMTETFSQSGMEEFEEYYNESYIHMKDNAVYGLVPQRFPDVKYMGTILVEKSKGENSLVYTAKSYYADYYHDDKEPNVYEIKETTFKLVKQDGVWLVDSFVLPD